MGISRNSINTFGSQIVIFVFSTLSSIIITRALGPVGKGIYTSIFIILLTIFDLFRLNMDVSSVYHLGSKRYKVEEFLVVFFLFAFILGGLAIGLYFILSKLIHVYFLKDVNTLYMNLAILSIPIYLMDLYFNSILWGLIEIKRYNLVKIFKAIFLTVFALIVVLFSKNVIYFIIANIASLSAAVLVNIFLLRDYIKKIRLRINISLMKNLLLYGYKGTLGNLLTSVIYRIGPYMVIYYCGMKAMGYYSIALYSELLWQIPLSINIALFPVMTQANADEKIGLTKTTCRNALFMTYSCAILLIIISRYLIIGLYGYEFSPAILPFCILLPGIAAGSISSTLRSYFNGIGKPEIHTYVSMITVVITPIIYVFLVKRAAIIGAALAGSIIYLLTAIILLSLFLKVTKSKISETVFIRRDDFKLYKEMMSGFYGRFGIQR